MRSEIGPDIARYYKGAGVDAEQRIRMFKLAWDATGTQFGQRMLQYERYYAGDPVRVAAAYYNDYDVAPLLDMVKRALATGSQHWAVPRSILRAGLAPPIRIRRTTDSQH